MAGQRSSSGCEQTSRFPSRMPRIFADPSFKKRLKKKETDLQASVWKCIDLLGENPFHPGLESHKVQGTDGVFESYVDSANRVTWHYGDDCIVLRNHCNHDIVKHNP